MHLIVGFLILGVLVAFANCQDISQEEVDAQLKMVNEITYLRDKVRVLESQKSILTETNNTKSEILKLKDLQINTLLEVISEYDKLIKVYNDQIGLQNQIISNNGKIVEEYQKASNRNNTWNTIKTVLYTLLGVMIGKL